MTKFIDGSFELEELKSFIGEMPSGQAKAYIFEDSTYVTSTIDELKRSLGDANLEVLRPTKPSKIEVKPPFDLVVLGGNYFLTVKNTALQANNGHAESLNELKQIVFKLNKLFTFE